ncbi:MAG: hypothetical protein GF383_09490 [Candidatus Lokiarchaeota archaeon]|nr:hypothetical protein [Candidatus Lokiarchaeota archaeon]MBD3340746.1 hypothetical protein [Candidatus Lokiarchaeota archaeon]
MAYIFHRSQFFGKYVINVAVAGNVGLKDTLNYLEMVAKTWGFEVVGDLGYLAAPKNTPIKIPSVKKDDTEEIIDKFYTAIQEKDPRKLTFEDHLTFRIMQTVYKKMESMSPYDYDYWKKNGWFEKNSKYFYNNIKRSILKDSIVRFIAWIGCKMKKELSNKK